MKENDNMQKAKKRKADKLLMSFLQLLIKLEPEHAAGIATLLGVHTLLKDEEAENDYILQELCRKFDELTTRRKKEMIKLMKQARK